MADYSPDEMPAEATTAEWDEFTPATDDQWAEFKPTVESDQDWSEFKPATPEAEPVDSPNVAGAKAAWQALNAPIIPIPRTTGEEIKQAYPFLSENTANFIAGAQRGAANLIEGIENPLGVAVGAAGIAAGFGMKAAGVLAKAGAAGYGALMAKHLPESAAQTEVAFQQGDIQTGVESAIGTVASAVLVPTIAGHLAPKSVVARVPEGIAGLVPPGKRPAAPVIPFVEETALALAEKPVNIGGPDPVLRGTVQEANAAPLVAEAMREIPPVIKEVKVPEDLTGMGGATPSEFTPPSKFTTANKNAVIDQEREARGLPPMAPVLRQSWGTALGEAHAKIDADATWLNRLTAELIAEPRPIHDFESAGLDVRRVDLKNEFNKAAQEGVKAADEGRLEDAADANAQANEWSNKLSELDQATGKGGAGTELGRGLAIRRMMLNEDFSIASLELQKRAKRDFEPLTPDERAELVKISEEHKAKSDALEKRVAEVESEKAAVEVQAAIDRLKAEAEKSKASPAVISLAEKIVAGWDKRADAARTRLKEKLWSTSTGIDPTILIDLTEIGLSHLGHIGLDFGRWSAEMVKDFGERVKPHLDEIWKNVQQASDATTEKGPEKTKLRRVIHKEGQSEHEVAIEKIKAKVEAGQGDDIYFQVQDLMRKFIADGILEREPMAVAVHGVLKDIIPGFTLSDTRTAIAGYGRWTPLTENAIELERLRIKNETLQEKKLEDMAAGRAPKATGRGQPVKGDVERGLIKQVEEAKKRGGYTVTDPATQLRSALQERERALDNQIADLTLEIQNKARTVKGKTKPPTSKEIEAKIVKRDWLRIERDRVLDEIRDNDPIYQAEVEAHKLNAQRTALEKQIEKLEQQKIEGDLDILAETELNRPADPVLEPLKLERDRLLEDRKARRKQARATPDEVKQAQATEARLKALEKAIAARETKIAAGDISSNAPAPKVSRPLLPELEQARQRLEAVNAKIAEMRKAAKPGRTIDEIANQAFQTRATNRMALLEAKLKAGDFTTKARREVKLDPISTKLRFELQEIERRFQIGLERDIQARRTTFEKGYQSIGKTIRLMRNFITTGEFSVVLKQGGFAIFSRPIRTLTATADLLRSLRSAERDFSVNAKLKARESYQRAKIGKVHLYEVGEKLSKMDEAVMSEWAERIPIMKGFQRSFSTYLNVIRMDSFEGLERTMARGRALSDFASERSFTGKSAADLVRALKSGEGAKFTPFEARIAGNAINVLTGRGTLRARENALVALNTWFFAPRYWWSRLQTIALQPIWHDVMAKGESAAALRTAIAGEYARYIAGVLTVLGLTKAFGPDVEIETDLNSSDAGSIIIGNFHIDLFSGLKQNTIFASRIATGEKTTGKGKVVQIRRTSEKRLKYGTDDVAAVTGHLLRTKLAPVPGSTLNLLSGSDVIGDFVTVPSELRKNLIPMTYRDIWKIMDEDAGIPAKLALSALAFLGAGVAVYE